MKKLLTFILFICPFLVCAQTEIVKSFKLNNESEVSLKFDYPHLVKINTWEKNEVAFKATVLIDDGEQDDKFSISTDSQRGTFYLKSKLEPIERNGNYHIVGFGEDKGADEVIMRRNGKKIVVNGDEKSINNGVEVSIVVEITVPEDLELTVYSKFGMVEVHSIPEELMVDAEFGGVDLTVNSSDLKELNASTAWGQIYTNLDDKMELNGGDGLGKDMIARLTARGKKTVFLGTNFGNVYIRKQ